MHRAVRSSAKRAPGNRADDGRERDTGDRHDREQQRAVRRAHLEVPLEPQVEPESPADDPEAHREYADGAVAQRRDLAEPREGVERRQVLLPDRAVVAEDLAHLGAATWHVDETPGRDRERGRGDGEREEHRAPFRGAVEGRRRERDEQRSDDEAGSSDGDVRREHPRARAHGEGVGEQRALHGDGGEHADAGEREYPEELPAVERRAGEEQGEHRHREQDAQHARAVRRRPVDEVPEWLREQDDGEAREHRDLHEEPEAPVVVVRDLDREDRGDGEDREAQGEDTAEGHEQREAARVEDRPQPHVVPADPGQALGVRVGRRSRGLRLAARLLVEHGGDEARGVTGVAHGRMVRRAATRGALDRDAARGQTGWTSRPVGAP